MSHIEIEPRKFGPSVGVIGFLESLPHVLNSERVQSSVMSVCGGCAEERRGV